ncbi:MAG: GtrA family protein [Fusobacteria bacterium]|nr:GtrA family protein [Fusobacteriota bacterium]
MALRHIKTFAKFGLVGASGAIVNVIIYTVCIHFEINYIVASIIGFLFAVTSNFYFNFKWTFKGKAVHKSVEVKYVKFFVISLINFCVNLIVLKLCVDYMFKHQIFSHIDFPLDIRYTKAVYLISQIVGILVATLLNFLGNALITFKDKKSER